ncbi:Atu4866 domain-containing protein [Flavobacterium sp. HJSW_4]|uniref:Atu4866 domain-containing protein n=1 Tax=Flavobacterium sp. HJSW_4 TaxID=3344660 RepID=UPI0035F2E580
MEKPNVVNLTLVFAFILAFLICSASAQEKQDSSVENSLKIVADQFQKWKNRTAVFFELLSDDATWTVSGRSPVSGKYEGKKDFMEHAVKPIIEKLKEPLKPEMISLTADDKYVWLHFKASAANKANEIYQNTYVWKLQLEYGRIINAVAFLDTYELVKLMQKDTVTMTQTIEQTKGYIGMWVTKDGYIRQELLTSDRYDEARGNRQSAYQGEYYVKENDIYYKDDTSF